MIRNCLRHIDNIERGIGLRIYARYCKLYFLFIPNSLKSKEIGVFEVPLVLYILLDYEDSLSGKLYLLEREGAIYG